MIAMTTSNSMSVKADRCVYFPGCIGTLLVESIRKCLVRVRGAEPCATLQCNAVSRGNKEKKMTIQRLFSKESCPGAPTFHYGAKPACASFFAGDPHVEIVDVDYP